MKLIDIDCSMIHRHLHQQAVNSKHYQCTFEHFEVHVGYHYFIKCVYLIHLYLKLKKYENLSVISNLWSGIFVGTGLNTAPNKQHIKKQPPMTTIEYCHPNFFIKISAIGAKANAPTPLKFLRYKFITITKVKIE